MARMLKTKDRVQNLLSMHPETRDNDTLLILAYLCLNHGLLGKIGEQAYASLKDLVLAGKVPSFETITRARRRLQAEHESLRGDAYSRRQTVDAPAMREWAKTKG